MRFEQLQAASAGSGAGADPADGEGPIGQGAAAVAASGDGDGGQTAAGDAPIPGEDTGPAVAQTSAVAVAPKAPAAQPVFAISDLIRSAADQASATWKSAAVPSQRRESPATPFRTVSAPGPVAPATGEGAAGAEGAGAVPTVAAAASPSALPPVAGTAAAPLAAPPVAAVPPVAVLPATVAALPAAPPAAAPLAVPPVVAVPPIAATAAALPAAPPVTAASSSALGAAQLADAAPATVPLVSPSPLSAASADDTMLSPIVQADTDYADYTAPAAPAAPTIPASPATAAASEADDDHWPGARRQIAILTLIVSLLILAVLLGHSLLPDVLGFGSLIDTFLPWTAVPLLLALPAALFSLKKWTIGVCLLTCAVWGGTFGPTLLRTAGSGPADIRVLSQNLSSGDDGTPDLSGVARLAEQRGADIVVLQGLAKNVQLADQAVPARYQYHVAMYEFVVWSRFPIGASQPVDLAGGRPADPQSGSVAVGGSAGEFGGLLRFTVDLGQNRQVTVYAVHLPQPSLSHDGFGLARGDALAQLVTDVQAEKSPNLVVVGDLDVAQTDRAIRPLLGSATGLVSAQRKAGSGFGFTWPATFPVVRLDDVLTRGLTPVSSVVLPAVGPQQAHRPIEADLKF